MIRISKEGDDYFINGRKVVDLLQFDIRERDALAKFKEQFVGLQVKSTFKKGGKPDEEKGKNSL